MTNPLLETWNTPFGLPPFDLIEDAHFAPAIETGMAERLAEVEAVANAPEAATFENTIEGLMRTGAVLDRVLGVFYNLAGSDSTEKREEIMREFSPKLAAHSAAIYGNRALFARVEAVWQGREALELTPEQARVLMLTHRGFVRAGAALEGDAAARMKEIKGRLATLGTTFGQNLLADERDWQRALSEAELEGMPQFVVDAVRAAGEERGADGPLLTLSRSVIVPFLQFCPNRSLREEAWRAWVARGENGGRPTTGMWLQRSSRCVRSGRSCWAMTISRPTSLRPRWQKRRMRFGGC